MKKDFFTFISHCELGITSENITPEEITKTIGIDPTRFFHKGEESLSKHSGSVITKPHNLWAVRSNTTLLKNDEDISKHIKYFQEIFEPKKNILEKYKKDPICEVSFLIWIETDDGGVGIDLNELEMDFLNSISNRIHFSFITKKKN